MAANKELIDAIALMREGNQEGFNIIYSQTSDYVYKRAKFIMKNEDDALDLMQETYTQVYKNIASLENVENIYAWIGAIVYRQGMRIFRDRKEILVDEEAEAIFDDIVSEDMETNPEESAEAKATVDIVMSFIEELPELQKAAIIAFYYDNKKIDDIAAEFECSSNTIKSRLNYAKKFLKDKVETHEKSHGYKLHTISPVIIIWALKALFGTKEYAILPKTAHALCANALKMSGVASATGATSTTVASTTVASTSAATSMASTATAVAVKVGMGIGAKLAIGAAAVAITAAVTAGVVAVVSDEEETTIPIVSATETVEESEGTSNIVAEENESEEATTEEVTSSTEPTTEENIIGWKQLEGEYAYASNEYAKPLVISNVRAASDDINDVTFDVEYGGQKGENVVINDRTVTFTVNNDDGSVTDVKLLIWTSFPDNGDYGKLIELVGFTTTTSDGMVADMNNNAPVIYSQNLAQQAEESVYLWPIEDAEYEPYTMFVQGTPDGYTYTVSISSATYENNYIERVVTIAIHDKDGQLVDTLVSEPFADAKTSYCNFWARSTEGYLFVGRLDTHSALEVLFLNCHVTGNEAPAWYKDINLSGYVKRVR